VPIAEFKAHTARAALAKPVKPASSLRATLGEAERNQILKALEQSQWVIAGPKGAAARLGMKRSTLQFRMRKLGIQIARTGA
jgi:formate hydrogenlyase transcriptional activator